MPILNISLQKGAHSQAKIRKLLKLSSELYADVLECPVDRVRVFITLFDGALVAVGGEPVSDNGADVALFDFLALEGRPLQQRQSLLTGFTELLVNELSIDRSVIRGACWTIPPEDWAIAGTPASVLRQREIADRAEQQPQR